MKIDLTQAQLTLAGEALALILEEISNGVLLLDSQGTLVYANQMGRQELAHARAVTLSGGRLVSADAFRQQRLARALDEARAGLRSMVQLGPGNDARMLAFVPLAGTQEGGSVRHVLVLCGRSGPADSVAVTLFAKAAGLTHGERDVLSSLCDGLDAQGIANLRDVKISTVRTQILSLRQKVGARNLPDLIAKVSSLPPLGCRLAN
jgi:DNA-binding CsgD family transcriptional regulator